MARSDVFTIARLAVDLLGQLANERAAAVIAAEHNQAARVGRPPKSAPRRGARVPAGAFLAAYVREDPNAIAMAPDVDPLELMVLACVCWAWPATSNADRWLTLWVLADRGRELAEQWSDMR